ncbi:MAG: DUF2155 domain-containing protein [Proteobacteria bacterium]|nr:DUF2155 domain-containing protein [Pseudomonadota bacterium]
MLVLFAAPGANAADYIDRGTAVIRIMNKAAGKTQIARIAVGKNAGFEKLSVLVRACRETPPYEMKDYFMFVEIGRKNPETPLIFSGWMSANDPGDNPLQDADYDLWLVKCE